MKKAAIEASSRVTQADHKQVPLEISDVPRILTPWRAMQPCNMPSRRWRREEINAARKALGNNASRDKKGRHSFCSCVHYMIKDSRVREDSPEGITMLGKNFVFIQRCYVNNCVLGEGESATLAVQVFIT